MQQGLKMVLAALLHTLFISNDGNDMRYQHATGTLAKTPLTGTNLPFWRGEIQRIGT